jgi:hypothetical protein
MKINKIHLKSVKIHHQLPSNLGLISAADLEPLLRAMTHLEVLDISGCFLDDALFLLPRGAVPAIGYASCILPESFREPPEFNHLYCSLLFV